MPTSGETRLKAKSIKKTSKDGISLKGKSLSKKIPESTSRRKVVSQPSSVKRSNPVPLKKGKENTDPNASSSGKTHKRSTNVKKAPDFSKLHRKWEDQLAKGKAVYKKKNTMIEAFNLTENTNQTQKLKRTFAYNSEDEEDAASDDGNDSFEIDSTALKGILNSTGIKDNDLRIAGRSTIAAISSSQSDIPGQSNTGIIKRTSIYYTRPKTQPVAEASLSVSSIAPSTGIVVSPLKPCNVDTTKPQATSSVRKQVAWADQAPASNPFDFQPDFNALQSILSNTGVGDNQTRVQNTGRVTLGGGRLTPYRRGRQADREEPTKRISIYYTGPKRTRPSPRGPGIRQTSVLSSVQRTQVATAATSAQSCEVTYNPFATVVGKQGIPEQDENDPISSLAARQSPTGPTAPVSQFPLGGNPLSTPARRPVSTCPSSAVRGQPSWADIFTPQRVTNIQESVAQASGSQSSFDSLPTPGRKRPFCEGTFTPQREVSEIKDSQGITSSTFASSSTVSPRRPLVDSNTQPQRTCFCTPQHPASNTSQSLTTQSADLSSRHAPSTPQVWRPQTSSQAPSHLQASCISSAKVLSTPARQGPQISQQLWPDIFTPQRVPLIQCSESIQCSSVQSTAAFPSKDPLATPLRQAMPVSQTSCSRQQSQVGGSIVTPNPGNPIQGRSSKLKCSAVQVTSFQPSGETEVSCSLAEARQPQQIPAMHKGQSESPPTKEDEDVALLERQALEDLRLFHISELSHEQTIATSSSASLGNDNSSSPRSAVSDTSIHCCDSNFSKTVTSRRQLSTRHVPTITSSNLSETTIQMVRSPARSLSLRSACSSSNPAISVQRKTATDTEFCWVPNGADDSTSAFQPVSSAFQRTPTALAKEALLDMEVATYMLAGASRVEFRERPANPLARMFEEGDSMHFLPINRYLCL